MNGVSDWDVAGGQALLRAVGGVVLSMDGTEFE
ncbi:MAG: inositol monophosphatase family protein [Alphaproteobacteria bacterium]